jgi:dTDP-L-rhamnose 4-epimerase
MPQSILITGGAGFIGSHLADELLRRGHRVRVLDALVPQVHGQDAGRPDYLDPEVEFVAGDVRDPEAVNEALAGIDAVYHFAAMVGVGQSMYQICGYTAVNNDGTAVLLEALARRPVGRLVVASSMSIYGEGLYRTAEGEAVPGEQRPLERLKAREWELAGPDGRSLVPVATPETKPPALASVYALSKFDQERLCLIVGQAYGIPTVALRFFNVYGPRQALSNPYTGVLAIFASRLLNDLPPLVFEDGRQRRDFVNVRDVARACADSLTAPGAPGRVIEVAERLARVLNRGHIGPEVTQRYRVGDIRHCFADISLAREVLGFAPRIDFDQGMEELAEWLEGRIAVNRFEEAGRELAERGLTV